VKTTTTKKTANARTTKTTTQRKRTTSTAKKSNSLTIQEFWDFFGVIEDNCGILKQLKGYEWVVRANREAKLQMFPKRVEYIYYPSHPNNRLIRQCLFDDNGDLKVILFLYNRGNGAMGAPDVDGYEAQKIKEKLQNDLSRTAYTNNAYDVNTASPVVRQMIEYKLGLSSTEPNGISSEESTQANDYCAQINSENYQRLKRILWIERVDAKSFNVHYGTENKQPTVTVKYTFSSDGPYKTKYEYSFDGMVKKEDFQSTISELSEVESEEVKTSEIMYDELDEQPAFPGGNQGLNSWLRENLIYPTVAQENGITGNVIVQFVVGKDGSISDARVTRGVDPSLDKEALRVVRSMPKWEPGKKDGECVNVRYTIPLSFRLQ